MVLNDMYNLSMKSSTMKNRKKWTHIIERICKYTFRFDFECHRGVQINYNYISGPLSLVTSLYENIKPIGKGQK